MKGYIVVLKDDDRTCLFKGLAYEENGKFRSNWDVYNGSEFTYTSECMVFATEREAQIVAKEYGGIVVEIELTADVVTNVRSLS